MLQQHLQHRRRFVCIAKADDGRDGGVHGRRRRPMFGAAARARRLSDVRVYREPGIEQAAGTGREVAGPSAGPARRSQGTVACRVLRQGQPAGCGVRPVPENGNRGGRDVTRVGRTTGRGPRGPRAHGQYPLPVDGGQGQEVGGGQLQFNVRQRLRPAKLRIVRLRMSARRQKR